MTPHAHIRHRLPGRARLRLPEARGDASYFAALEEWLASLDEVQSARGDYRTGGLLLLHTESSLESVAERASAAGWFHLESPQETPLSGMAEVNALLSRFDARLRNASREELDLRALLFLTLMALAVRQILRGQIMAPAVTLLWYAQGLLNGIPVREQ